MPHIDVEIAGQERSRRVTSAALMRRRVVNLHQLACDERIVRVSVLEIAPKLRARHKCIEHRCSGDRSIYGQSACLATYSNGLVQSHQTRGRDEGDGWKAMRIARSEHDRVGAGERRRDENRRLVDDATHEIRDEGYVETRRVSNRRSLRHAEAQ